MTGMNPPKSIMPCEIQASGAIEQWFYGELDPDERRGIEFHLAACAECRGALDELKTIRSALATRPVITAPPGDDWTSLMSRIDLAVAHESRSPAKVAAMAAPRSQRVPATLGGNDAPAGLCQNPCDRRRLVVQGLRLHPGRAAAGHDARAAASR